MQRDLRRLADTKFDVIVVGAGFYGVTTAWDAAQRGLSVAIIDKDDFDRLPPASEEEEDMLDLAAGAVRTSRLSCQIELTPELDGLTVRVPPEARDMRRF